MIPAIVVFVHLWYKLQIRLLLPIPYMIPAVVVFVHLWYEFLTVGRGDIRSTTAQDIPCTSADKHATLRGLPCTYNTKAYDLSIPV